MNIAPTHPSIPGPEAHAAAARFEAAATAIEAIGPDPTAHEPGPLRAQLALVAGELAAGMAQFERHVSADSGTLVFLHDVLYGAAQLAARPLTTPISATELLAVTQFGASEARIGAFQLTKSAPERVRPARPLGT